MKQNNISRIKKFRIRFLILMIIIFIIIITISLFLPEKYITIKTIRGKIDQNLSLNITQKYNYLTLVLQNINYFNEENITDMPFDGTQKKYESLFYDELFGTGIYSYMNLFSAEDSIDELVLSGDAKWVPGGEGSVILCKNSSLELFVDSPFEIQIATIGDTMFKNNFFYFPNKNDSIEIYLKEGISIKKIWDYKANENEEGLSRKITIEPNSKNFSLIIKPIINSRECIQMYSLLLEGGYARDARINNQKRIDDQTNNLFNINFGKKNINFSSSDIFFGDNFKILIGHEKGKMQFLETFNDPKTIRLNIYERTGIISKTEEEYGSIVLRPDSSITYLIKSPFNITSLKILNSPTESNMFVLTNGKLDIEYSFDMKNWNVLYSLSTNGASPLNPNIPLLDNINQKLIYVRIKFSKPGNGNQVPILQMYNIMFDIETQGISYTDPPKKIDFSSSYCNANYLIVLHKNKDIEEKEIEEIINGYYGQFSIKGEILSHLYRFLAFIAFIGFLFDINLRNKEGYL